jgi:DNA (cytosine-5)-methyltransferase 1
VRRTISLFTGVGGLDLGLEAAGFAVAVAAECDRDAVEAIRKNRDWLVIQDGGRPLPLEEISSRTLLKAARLREGEAALLVGGPPCQPFSKSGYWATGDALRLRDPRANTLRQFRGQGAT